MFIYVREYHTMAEFHNSQITIWKEYEMAFQNTIRSRLIEVEALPDGSTYNINSAK